MKNADRIEADLAETKKNLEAIEDDMASGDLNAWVINTLRTFKAGYKVEMPQFSATLLGLMGISSGTYLGIKVPEKASTDAPA